MTGVLAAVLAGGDNHALSLANATVTDNAVGVAVATYSLTNGGEINSTTTAGSTDIGDWIAPKDSFSNYYAIATLNSGTLDSGVADGSTQQNLGTSRLWTCAAVSPSTQQAQITVKLYREGTSIELASAVINLDASPT